MNPAEIQGMGGFPTRLPALMTASNARRKPHLILLAAGIVCVYLVLTLALSLINWPWFDEAAFANPALDLLEWGTSFTIRIPLRTSIGSHVASIALPCSRGLPGGLPMRLCSPASRDEHPVRPESEPVLRPCPMIL